MPTCGGTCGESDTIHRIACGTRVSWRKEWELKFKKPWAPCPVDALTFVGHYWLDADEAGPLTEKLACLDCSVAKGGALCAYRHDEGRTTLDPAAFVTVPAAD